MFREGNDAGTDTDTQSDTAPALSRPLRVLVEAVGLMRSQLPTELADVQALSETGILLSELQKLTAISLARIADVHARELHTLAGSPSTGSWIEAQHADVDRKQLALARKLARLPLVAQEVAGGALSMAAACAVGEALDKVRRHLDRPDGLLDGQDAESVLRAVLVDGVLMLVAQARGGFADDDPGLHELASRMEELAASPLPAVARVEAGFVALAQQVEPHLVRRALDHLVDAILPLQLVDREERTHRNRGLTLTRKQDGSGWTVTAGDLDLECGELLWTVLHAERATDPANPTDTAAWAQLDEMDMGPAPRSRRQRDHDALKLALRRFLDSGILGQRDKAAPHLTVTVGLDALHDAPGALPGLMASGSVAPARLVRTWLADSHLTRVVLSKGRRVLEVSHGERTLRAHERRAMTVQWGGRCAAAGCRNGLDAGLVPHHVRPWHLCGQTSLSDSVPLCEQSHQDLHRGGHVLKLKDGRFIDPLGWTAGPESAP